MTHSSSHEKESGPTENQTQVSPRQSDALVKLCEGLEFFRTSEDEGFVMLGGLATKVRSEGFRNWLRHEYFKLKRRAPSSQPLQDAVDCLDARACFEGAVHPVFLRVASFNDAIYVDLGDPQVTVVEITESGWSCITTPPIRFTRSKTMLPMPKPVAPTNDDSIESLKPFLNVRSHEDFQLAVAWILSALNPNGPFPILTLYGEQGSAKSTTTRVLRELTDPSSSPLRALPKRTEDLMVTAKNNRVLGFDNVSFVNDELSDDFCRLSTGGGLAKRRLYSDDSEHVLDATRPLILNGIDEFVARGDLASRTIFLSLPPIAKNQRRLEEKFWDEFRTLQPRILGLLFWALAEALANKDSFTLESPPRMADAWHFVTAAESAFGWPRGSSLKAYAESQRVASETVLDGSPLSPGIRKLAVRKWEGTAEALLAELEKFRPDAFHQSHRLWPANPKSLSDKVRRLSPCFKDIGIDVEFSRTSGSDSKRWIRLGILANNCDANDA